MYGQNTDDTYIPSAQVQETPATVNDRRNKEVFKTQKVRDVVVCEECLKPRCIYSDKKLTREQVSLRNLLILVLLDFCIGIPVTVRDTCACKYTHINSMIICLL